MTSDVELKACPLCGGEATLDEFENDYGVRYFLRCTTCELSTNAISQSRSEAIAAWNRRPSEPERGYEVSDKARKALDVYREWAINVSTLGELADLERRMNDAGISLLELGALSSPPDTSGAAGEVSGGVEVLIEAYVDARINARNGSRETYLQDSGRVDKARDDLRAALRREGEPEKPYAFANPSGGPQPLLLAHHLEGRRDRKDYSIPLYAHPSPVAGEGTGWRDIAAAKAIATPYVDDGDDYPVVAHARRIVDAVLTAESYRDAYLAVERILDPDTLAPSPQAKE